MHRNPIRSRLCESGDKFVWILDHQVAIEWQVGHFAERLYYRRPDRKIGDKMPIHDVAMDDARPALAGSMYLLAETGKVRRKNRRC